MNESTGIVDRVTDQQPVDELMGSLQRLGRLLASRQVASRIATAAGVDVTQQGAALLRVLLREGQQPIAVLAASVPMDLGAASRQVRLLEDAGLVRTERVGRYKFHYLDTTPLHEIAERWPLPRKEPDR